MTCQKLRNFKIVNNSKLRFSYCLSAIVKARLKLDPFAVHLA